MVVKNSMHTHLLTNTMGQVDRPYNFHKIATSVKTQVCPWSVHPILHPGKEKK